MGPEWEYEAGLLWDCEKEVRDAQERVDQIKGVLKKAESRLQYEIRLYRSAYQECDVAMAENEEMVYVEDVACQEIYNRYYE